MYVNIYIYIYDSHMYNNYNTNGPSNRYTNHNRNHNSN